MMKSSRVSNKTAIDLFSGCGGMTTGLKLAGFSVIGAVEIDTKARETFTLNHPDVPLLGTDIRKLSTGNVKKALGFKKWELDLLAGCPPCQGFSTLRRRNMVSVVRDDRNKLIEDFQRFALELMPKLIMMENVAGLQNYSRFQAFVKCLRRSGYNVVYDVLDVADYGVPQRRKRLILSANYLGEPRLAEPNQQKKLTVRSAIGNLPNAGSSGDALHDYSSLKRSQRIQNLIAAIPKDGGGRHDLPEHLQLACHKRTSGFNDVYGRMKWDDVAPTITGGCTNPSKGRFLHPTENRPITLREAAVLQGFPQDYKFDIRHGKEAISLMIGNALPPSFIYAHSKKMAEEIM